MTDPSRSNQLKAIVWSVAGLGGATLVWLQLAPYIVPDLVLTAYKDRFPNPERTILWHGALGCAAVWAGGWLVWWSVRNRVVDRLIPEATAQQLGGIRILVCSILLMSTLWEDLASTVYLPKEMRNPLGLLKILYQLPIGFEQLHNSYAALITVKYVTALFLLLACLGLWTRVVIPLAAFGYLVVSGTMREYAWGYHLGLLPLQVLIVLAFMPCGDGLSLDRRIRLAKGKVDSEKVSWNPGYGYSVFICWLVMALAYFSAGISKIREGGWMWWHHENLQTYLYNTSLTPMQFDFRISLALREMPTFVFSVLGFVGLFMEVLYPIVLFSRTARMVIPVLALGFHVGVFFLQNILFFDLMILQLVFFPWTNLLPRMRSPFDTPSSGLQSAAQRSGTSRPVSDSIRTRTLGTAGILLITAISLSGWKIECEFYPFTSWSMFKFRNTTGQVTYHKPLVFYTNGDAEEARFDRWIGAMADSRYRGMIEVNRHPEVARKFFDACIKRANASDPKGRTVDHFEIETWRWDFRNEPKSPTYGNRVDIVIYPLRDNRPDSERPVR